MKKPVLLDNLPFLTGDLPGIQGKIRVYPEDFQVEECPLYEPCGEGEHLYIRITKRGLATPQLVSLLSSRFGIPAKSIGVAGLKDARAVTTQFLSIQGVSPEVIGSLVHEQIVKLEILGWHTNRLRTGHHAGNRFVLTIREVEAHAQEVVPQVMKELSRRGIPNYFGPQRQGRGGENFVLGARLLKDEKKRSRMPKAKRVWFVNAYQSFLFNQILARRLPQQDCLMIGDWAIKHLNGACFHVEQPEVEQPRADSFEISPTGPLFGSRASWATGVPGEIELAAIQGFGETRESLTEAGRACRIRGERRALRVPLKEFEWQLTKDVLELRFLLPPGSYATSVLRELMKVSHQKSEMLPVQKKE